MMKLNKAQKEFLLSNWFEPQELAKIFETADMSWLAGRDIELAPDSSGWPKVIVDGEAVTAIRAAGCESLWQRLLSLGSAV